MYHFSYLLLQEKLLLYCLEIENFGVSIRLHTDVKVITDVFRKEASKVTDIYNVRKGNIIKH